MSIERLLMILGGGGVLAYILHRASRGSKPPPPEPLPLDAHEEALIDANEKAVVERLRRRIGEPLLERRRRIVEQARRLRDRLRLNR